MPNPIPTPDMASDAAYVDRVNRKSRAGGTTIVVDPEQKVAIVYLPLAPGVDQPGDYAAIRTAIEAVTGIQDDVTLVVDGQVPTRAPDGFHWVLNTEAAFRLVADPVE